MTAGRWRVLAVGIVLAVAFVAVAPMGPPAADSRLSPASESPAMSGLSVNTVFQGTSIAGHDSPSSAIPSNFNQKFTTIFYWNSTPNAPVTITQGQLQIQFFGATIGTSSQSIVNAQPNVSGRVTMSSDFTQNRYLFEGVYEVIATLSSNGATLYQATFYVWIQATDHLTIVNIALIVIAAYEMFQIAELGSVRVARKELGIAKPPKGGKP